MQKRYQLTTPQRYGRTADLDKVYSGDRSTAKAGAHSLFFYRPDLFQ
jgi:hypothetical protein